MDLPGTKVSVAACLRKMRLTVTRVTPMRPAIALCSMTSWTSTSTSFLMSIGDGRDIIRPISENYVSPGCVRSRRSPDLEVSIAPGRRAEILIAVTAGGYCLTRLCSRGGHTTCREAKQLTNTIPLSSAEPPASKTRFSRVNCMPGTHFIELFVFVAFADMEHIFRQLP